MRGLRWLGRRGAGAGRRLPRPGGRRRVLPGPRVWIGVFAGLIAYAGFLIAQWPASHAWEQAQRHLQIPPGVEVGGLQGTVWEGRAVNLEVQGFAVESFSWRVPFRPLLRGRLVVEIDASLDGGFVEGRATAWADGVRVDGASGRVPARRVEEVVAGFSPRPPQLEGSIAFSVERLEAGFDGWPRALDGRIAWHDAAVTVDYRAELGGVTSTLGIDGDGVLFGRLGDTGGPLALDGEWRLRPDGSYTLDTRAETRSGADEVLVQTLAMLGNRVSLEGQTAAAW